MELLTKNLGILPLDACGHRLTDIRKGLMAVETAQFDNLPIQRESLRSKDRFPKSYAPNVFVDDLPRTQQLDSYGVKPRPLKRPQFNSGEILERDGLPGGVVSGLRAQMD